MFKRKFPANIQSDTMDCGPACLKIVSKYYGKNLSIKYLRDLCFITREGISLNSLSHVAEKIGFSTLAVKGTFYDLMNKMPLPVIIHWQQRHFMIVYKVTKSKVYVSDPANGLVTYGIKDFRAGWEHEDDRGIALMLEPSNDFYKILDNDTSMSLSYFFGYLKPYKKYLFQVLFGILLSILITIFTPFISQAIVDFGIGSNSLNFVNIMLLAGVMLALSSLLSKFIQNRIMLFVSERINMRMVSDFLRKILYLTVDFFERKMVSDILVRISDLSRIQSFLMDTILGMFLNIILFVTYTGIMLYYQKNMFLVFIMGYLIYFCWIILFLKKRKKLDNMLFEAKSDNQNNLLELLNNVNEIKANNIANRRRWKWEYSRFRIYGIDISNMNLDQLQTIGATFISEVTNVVLIYIAAKNVIQGNMTLGMMMAVQSIIGQLSGPIASFINYVQDFQLVQLSLRRVNEVLHEEKEKTSVMSMEVPQDKTIKLKNVNFSYDPLRKGGTLKNINIDIPDGKVTAIVGESGSGKSTLMKLLLRFYLPSEGEILVGNIPLENIDIFQWRGEIGSVLQEGKLFNDTILYNITLEEENFNIDVGKLGKAIKIANLEDFIEHRPQKIYTQIGSSGSGLSQGQRQRILIARAIYKDPSYIFLDEATNSLDANNERDIVCNMDEFMKGRTTLIIAHRLSTVRDADNIIVMRNGEVVEQGCNEYLMSLKGAYYQLIKNQLQI